MWESLEKPKKCFQQIHPNYILGNYHLKNNIFEYNMI